MSPGAVIDSRAAGGRGAITPRRARPASDARAWVFAAHDLTERAEDRRGADGFARCEPLLEGFHVGSTWRAFADGAMHAEGSVTHTVVVALPARNGAAPAHVLTRLPMSFERITALPGLHGDGTLSTSLMKGD